MTNNAFLIDSDVLINFLDKGKNFPHDFEKSHNGISVISYYEVKYGTLKTEKGDLFERFIEDATIEIFDLTQAVTDQALKIRISLEKIGSKLPHLDLFIAATALVYNLRLITENLKHYQRIPNLRLYLPDQHKKMPGSAS